MAYDPTIGSGQVGRDRTRPRLLNPTDQVADIVATIEDSRRGLRTAAEAIDDSAVTGRILEMSERRERHATAIVDVAAGAGIVMEGQPHGKVSEAIRRGWMRVEDALGSNDAVLETVTTQERSVAEEVAGFVGRGLPVDLDRELQSVSGSILDDVAELKGLAGPRS